ncbi:replication protein A 70 kDa DNA-binding subunit A-like protein [Tanacetum coccineum]
MAVGALSKRISGTYDMNPVVQVIDIKSILSRIEVKGDKVENKVIYDVVLSDGLICEECQIYSGLNELIRSNKMQQGSIVQLTNFEINPV